MRWDDKQHLIRVFWADAIGRKNYASFGDVVSFDTTFSMNEYCMVFAPFTGVDNSKSCVTFAAALLYKEDTESFVWLFEAFRAAMSDCDPTCIITDQDPAMKIAIERVFDSSRTRHRLCMWHIMKKVPEKSSVTVFGAKHTELEEFDEVWNSILEKYDLMNNTWLQHMFQIRDDWIPSYYRNMPMSGVMRTTSRSESENNFFGHFTTPHCNGLSKTQAVQTVISVQKLKATEKTPLDLEKHASKLYTHTIFYEFQNELLAACFNCGLHSMIPDENIQIVTLIDHKRNSKIHTVRHHLENNSAECTCKMYEREGIPCRHILWVMKEKGLKSLPAAYIKTQWTKAAMNMPMFDLGGNLIEDTTNMEAVKKKVGHLWSEIFTCVSMEENNEDCLDDFMKLIDGFKQSLLSRGNLQASGDKGKQMETLLDCP
ncbi:Protein FAR1-RELATED SEQUENCE 5, partial [Bienertia sinuspersici]